MLRRALRKVSKALMFIGIAGVVGSIVSALSGQELILCGMYACVSVYIIGMGVYIWSENRERASARKQIPNQHDTDIVTSRPRECKMYELYFLDTDYRTKLEEPIF